MRITGITRPATYDITNGVLTDAIKSALPPMAANAKPLNPLPGWRRLTGKGGC
jgi:hypothetical protein